MDVLTHSSTPRPPHSTVLTIGFYDGVHLGHRRTLGRALDAARASGRELIVVTFDRHPSEVVQSHHSPKLLCDLTQRLELFDSLGVDATYVIEFDEEAAERSAAAFIREVLVDQLGAAEIIVGWDFRFGAGREGDVAVLTDAGHGLGFSVTGVTLGEADGEVISSTRIRSLVAAGDVSEAARLLDRVHELRGKVVHGDGRGGADLGIPTVNLAVDGRYQLPGDGVYAGWYRDGEHEARPAAISVGRRPTFYNDAEPLVEAHLLDFEGDLYGWTARVSFLERLRGEERFDSAEALITQMLADVEATRVLCAALAERAPKGLEGSEQA